MDRSVGLRLGYFLETSALIILSSHGPLLTIFMQEHHFALLKRETEKLQGDIEKLRSELRLA